MKYISYQTIYHAIVDFQMAEYATVGSGKAFDALSRVLDMLEKLPFIEIKEDQIDSKDA